MKRRRWLLVLAIIPLASAWAQGGMGTQEAERESSGAADCVTRALDELFLSHHDAVLLCQGAESDAPVECFRRVSEETFLEKTDILTLCSPILSGDVLEPL